MIGMSVPSAASVAVVGSANLDIVVALDRVPRRGETVFGREYAEFPGGKGANQAIAAARVVRSSLIAEVGTDAAGRTLAVAVDPVPLQERRGASRSDAMGSSCSVARAYLAPLRSVLRSTPAIALLCRTAVGPTLPDRDEGQFVLPIRIDGAVASWLRNGDRLSDHPLEHPQLALEVLDQLDCRCPRRTARRAM